MCVRPPFYTPNPAIHVHLLAPDPPTTPSLPHGVDVVVVVADPGGHGGLHGHVGALLQDLHAWISGGGRGLCGVVSQIG